MLNTLAQAIITGLIAGASASTSKLVADTYEAALSLLKRLVPRFDPSRVVEVDDRMSIEELANRLRGNTPEELSELAAVFSELAGKLGAPGQKAALDRIVEVDGVSAAHNVDVDIATRSGSKDSIRSVSSINGSVKIVTRQIKD